ncbi:uncharacterized protein M421DRAFT_394374 [Didymella exigua CBS 183.55]|uniref:Uncharacterized protein n=1 Tax=Didymella exigua CBS 183.55 TaxID=1150837 RepID=A0A6A5RLM8_9PLEO|nr:uncharacterized protein M421DRAFT_394374 [Didymella exigua CBS 183.55]KAF1927266.1 hypothetical protein M421DRAFT_394374 [Didymella exigua CBS 183.55]
MTLKRPYPFGDDHAHMSYYTQQEHAREATPIDEPLCLLGSVRPMHSDQIIVLSSLQVLDVNAQARREVCDFIRLTYPPETDQHDIPFEILPKGDYFELLSNGHAFARLDKAFCSEARRLVGLEVRFQAYLKRGCWEEAARASRSCVNATVTFSVDVNVKSLRNHADKVGNILLRSGIRLQSPTHNPGGETYYNPQMLHIEGPFEKPDDIMTEPEGTPTPAVVLDRPAQSNAKPRPNSQNHVEQILDSLSHTNILHEIRTDTNRIKSTLMRHQMMALDFIAQRESSRPSAELTFWREKRRNGETYFQHKLTKSEATERREASGGILADDMGLGKSLTMLSAIASSLQEAERFASIKPANAEALSDIPKHSPATLIVVPSTNCPTNAHRHTFPHKVTFHKHLSTERHAEINLLFKKDIVLTTYATALEDTKKSPSPLSKIHWFRIVLDEAHKIRNQNTKMFRAVQQLPAQRRWCLTGAPIQNRLEDLGSLVAFLRLRELARMSNFRTYIITPTLSDRGNQFANLQTLLRTICLRRTRDILGLPQPITHPRSIRFSDEERHQYTDLYEHYKRQIQIAVSGNGRYASTTLQSIHELRLFCNNGLRRRQDEPHESDDETLSYLLQLEENACSNCGTIIFCIDKEEGQNRGMFIRPCRHLVCHSCWPQCVEKKKDTRCLLCTKGHPTSDFTTHVTTVKLNSAANEVVRPHPSKLLALLDDIKQTHREKCIVFSAWKKTLDLAAGLLTQAGLKHSMMHGGLSSKQRQKVLKDFKSLMGSNILLMTLGTGAEGLNLTVATHIYLLEPQWNPFVELQAMARAQRIGQTKQVVCVRYVMEETIEQSDVLNRQKTKTRLAGGGFKNQNMNDSLVR